MLHQILYTLHVIGMIIIVSTSFYLISAKNIAGDVRKKLSGYLMGAAHTQLLTGFILFFTMLSEVKHGKIGMKMLLAIAVAVLATSYRRTAAKGEVPKPALIIVICVLAISSALIAFFL